MGFWSKVKKAAKKAAKAVKKAVEVVVDVVTTVIGAIVVTLESLVIAWVGGFLGGLILGLLTIPYIGRVIDWIFQAAKTIFWRFIGIIDFILGLIGILPEKKLRVCVVALRDDKDYFTTEQEIIDNINNLIRVFKDEANVRVLPSSPFTYSTPFSDNPSASADWIHFKKNPSSVSVLDVECKTGAAKEDLGLTGGLYQDIMFNECFFGNFRRLVGYGAPIGIILVRDVKGKNGCSLGPLVDYVTTSGSGIGKSDFLFAHECAHACALIHCGDFGSGCDDGNKNNLMFPSPTGRGTDLNRWQVAVLRNSRHVTYL